MNGVRFIIIISDVFGKVNEESEKFFGQNMSVSKNKGWRLQFWSQCVKIY